ncbi:MAG: choice-of-anchor B family protein [Gemmatimonadetes bacterium]|nr:choice-of-anchor B family protein [Gemmatimonadota bacterium]
MLPRYWKRTTCLCAMLLLSASTAFALDGKNVEQLGRANDFIAYSDVWGYRAPDGRDYAIIGTQWGTAFYNVEDPRNPDLVGFVGGPESIWRDMKTYGAYCYVTTEGSGVDEGMQIIDLTDPESPTLVGTYTTTFTTAHNLHVDSTAGLAIVCGASGGTHILDVTTPTAPVRVGQIASPYAHDVMAKDDVLYTGNINIGQFRLWDISNPASPSLLSATSYPTAFTHNAWPTEDNQYVLSTDENAGGRVRIWDVSDLGSITQVAQYQTGPPTSIVHNAMVKGDIAYVSYYTEGLRLVDITDPTNPSELGFLDTFLGSGTGFKGSWGIFPYTDNGTFYGSDIGRGLFVAKRDTTYGGCTGTVESSLDASPILNANVSVDGTLYTQQVSKLGDFWVSQPAGNYTVTIDRHGYQPVNFPINIAAGSDTALTIVMTPYPTGSISGTIEDASNNPLEDVVVELVGVSYADESEYIDSTDASGAYSFSDVPEGTWQVRARLIGYNPGLEVADVPSGGADVVDFALADAFFADDFSTDKGWTIGAAGDNATAGVWERASVIGREVGKVVPSYDQSPGFNNFAMITERGLLNEPLEESEVDGKTSVLSPIFDLTSTTNPTISFYRFHSVNAGYHPYDGDAYETWLSNDGGSNWILVDAITTNDINLNRQWREVAFKPSSFLALTNDMRVKITVTDQGAESVVESGIDDFSITEGIDTYVGVDIADGESGAPARPILEGNFPNPFNPTTSIRFTLPSAALVELDVYDTAGRLVKRLDRDAREAGNHTVAWDGRNDRGDGVASGVYFYTLRTDSFSETRKMLLVR